MGLKYSSAFTCCYFNLAVPQFPDLYNGGSNSSYCIQTVVRIKCINICKMPGMLPSDLNDSYISHCKQIDYCLVYQSSERHRIISEQFPSIKSCIMNQDRFTKLNAKLDIS